MDNEKKGGLSGLFNNRAVKGGLAGAGVAIVAAAALPFVAVSTPVVVTGAVVGAIWNAVRKR